MHAAAKMIMRLRPADGGPVMIDYVYDNAAWKQAREGALPRLSVLIPAFRYDASPLIDALAACNRSELVEIIVQDDGSRDETLTARLEAAADRSLAPVRVVSASRNRGRSGARNQAVSHARAEWLLLLDSDMAPDTLDFLSHYLSLTLDQRPGVIVGGYSLKQASREDRFALHRWQAEKSECLPADERNQDPGRHVFTSNVVVHRDVLAKYSFDESFSGWGWEDVDWGLRVAKDYPVVHIDNTATHLGLDSDEALLGKYLRSGKNFALLVQRHRAAMSPTPLYRAAMTAKRLPFRSPLGEFAKKVAANKDLSVGIRGRALKLARALAYAEAMS